MVWHRVGPEFWQDRNISKHPDSYPTGYPTAAPAYNPNMYPTSSPGYAPGYTAGTPYKVPPTQSNNAPPPYSPSPNPYQTAMYPIRSAYPQQNLYTQGAYYTQPVYAAQPHVIHHTTVVQPNSIPSAIYPAPVAAPRTNGVAMGMVAGTTMAMSAGFSLKSSRSKDWSEELLQSVVV
ncbi:Myelin-associated neurite-outgrowth inhibitor [Pitangus sulphuratus]|nr:Myelin-associated neurite-outgrowth inhibitor [Pitangus sulphuratus]